MVRFRPAGSLVRGWWGTMLVPEVILVALLAGLLPRQARAGDTPTYNPEAVVKDAQQLPQGQFVLLGTSRLAYTSDLFADGSDDVSFVSRFGLMVGAWDFLSAGVSLASLGNYHALRLPATSQTVGDTALSLRFATPIATGLATSLQVGALLPTSADGVGFALTGTSPSLLASLSYTAPFGLGAQLNLGARLLRNELVFAQPLEPVLRYAAQSADAGLIDAALGIDYRMPLGQFFSLTPYLAGLLVAPVYQVDLGQGLQASVDGGLRMGVGRQDALSFIVGGRFNLLRHDPLTVALPALPPWSAQIGLQYRFDPFAAPEVKQGPPPKPIIKTVIKEKKVIKEVAVATGTVRGKVINKLSGEPIINALVRVDGSDASPLSVGGADGQFMTYPLVAKRPYKLIVVAPGFDPAEANVMVTEGQARDLQIAMIRSGEAQFGEIRGSVKNSTGEPLAATIIAFGVKGGKTKTDPKTGSFVLKLPIGRHTVAVGAKKYRTQKKKIVLRPGDVVILNVDMAK